MSKLSDRSIDAVITDLPYGRLNTKWDSVIPFSDMWLRLELLVKKNAPIILFSNQPFTSLLISSNIKNFREEIIWQKDRASNFANAMIRHMKIHENIIVFSYSGKYTYNRQLQKRNSRRIEHGIKKGHLMKRKADENFFNKDYTCSYTRYNPDYKNPESVIYNPLVGSTSKERKKGQHPAQKPIKLMEYLIKTYTNENELVLDFTMGSGTTGVACKSLNRNFVGIEKDEKYFEIAKKRINSHISLFY